MPSDLRLNTSLDADQRLAQLLAQQADIEAQNARVQAEIAALFPSSSPQHSRSPIHKHRNRRSANASRNLSSSGTTMARQLSDRSELPSQRSRTLSQRSAPAPSMARMNSRGASSESSGNLGFAQSTNTTMPPPFPSEPQEHLAMETWMKDQPLTSYTFSHQPPRPQRSASQRGYPLEQVNELEDVGENPHEFLSRTVGTPSLAFPEYSTQSSATLNDNRLAACSFTGATPTTPTTDSLTIASTLQSSMSRQSSIGNEPVLESFQMMKVNSNASYFADVNSSDHNMFDAINPPFITLPKRRSSREEQKLLLAGLGGASHDSDFPPSFPSADSFVPTSFGERMEKSPSNESTSSASSSRSKQRLLATVAAARPLMPRGGSDENMSRTNSSQSINRLESNDGSQDKVAIPKPTYQRPKHERVFCKQCDSNSDGFRGEHELRRHQDREHKPMVKKWVCIEPTGSSHAKPVSPLSKCKACCQQKKYGAYYNAAAHLRRTHFNPKPKSRNKAANGDGGERRAGKGGGDWPAMSELKFWMKEVEEPAAEYPPTASQEDDIDADASDDTPLQNDLDEDTLTTDQTPSGSNFDDTFLASTSPMPSIYASTNSDYYVPHDLASEQGSFADSSMYGSNNFHFSPSFSNDAMAFFDSSLSQTFDDPASAGLDFTAVSFSYQ